MFRFTIRDVLWLVVIFAPLGGFRISARAADAGAVLFPYHDTAGWGYINRNGDVVVKPQFQFAYDFANELGKVTTASGSTSFINASGEVFLELGNQFPVVLDFSNDRAAFSVNEKWGFIDRSGKIVIEAKYDDTRAFSEGFAAVNVGAVLKRGSPHDSRAGGKWGFVDRSGRVAIPVEFEHVDHFGFRDGLALVEKARQVLYIKADGRTAFQLHFEPNHRIFGPRHFCDGLARVDTAADPGYTGFVDKTGKVVIEPRFEAGEFSEGLCTFTVDRRKGYMDKSARIVIEPQFAIAGEFSEGLAITGDGERFGFIDKGGQIVIAQLFNDAEPFRGGLARVHVGGTYVQGKDSNGSWQGGAWNYINRNGDKVHHCRSDDAPGALGYGRENLK